MTCSSIIRGMSCLIALVVWFHASSKVALPAETAPRRLFHLTARPWRPLEIQRERYLDVLEGLFRFSIRHQNDQGAIIDPFLHREHQYATPYFAYAVGTLIAEGKATDLSSHGILAMIESAWTERQSKRIAAAPFFLYHDGGVSCEAKHHCRTSGTCGGRRIRHTARR